MLTSLVYIYLGCCLIVVCKYIEELFLKNKLPKSKRWLTGSLIFLPSLLILFWVIAIVFTYHYRKELFRRDK